MQSVIAAEVSHEHRNRSSTRRKESNYWNFIKTAHSLTDCLHARLICARNGIHKGVLAGPQSGVGEGISLRRGVPSSRSARKSGGNFSFSVPPRASETLFLYLCSAGWAVVVAENWEICFRLKLLENQWREIVMRRTDVMHIGEGTTRYCGGRKKTFALIFSKLILTLTDEYYRPAAENSESIGISLLELLVCVSTFPCRSNKKFSLSTFDFIRRDWNFPHREALLLIY